MNSRMNTISPNKMAVIVLAFATCQNAYGQTGVNTFYNPPASMSGKTVIIPAGTTFEGRIETTIGSATSKRGERFSIEISSPVLANSSDVLIPPGAEIVGEVVEAIPSSKVPHKKHEKPPGKLRIQITALKMPDGTMFPMVASLVGESLGGSANPNLGGGMAYAGSNNSFETVSPSRMAAPTRSRRGRATVHVVTKQELMRDPILGKEANADRFAGQYDIRSLIKKKRDLYIYQGSPLTVHLDAAFKMGIGVARSAASSLEVPARQTSEESNEWGHRRFSRNAAPPPEEQTPPAPPTGPGVGVVPPLPMAPPGAAAPSTPGAPAAPAADSKPLPFQVPPSKTGTQSAPSDDNF